MATLSVVWFVWFLWFGRSVSSIWSLWLLQLIAPEKPNKRNKPNTRDEPTNGLQLNPIGFYENQNGFSWYRATHVLYLLNPFDLVKILEFLRHSRRISQSRLQNPLAHRLRVYLLRRPVWSIWFIWSLWSFWSI